MKRSIGGGVAESGFQTKKQKLKSGHSESMKVEALKPELLENSTSILNVSETISRRKFEINEMENALKLQTQFNGTKQIWQTVKRFPTTMDLTPPFVDIKGEGRLLLISRDCQ